MTRNARRFQEELSQLELSQDVRDGQNVNFLTALLLLIDHLLVKPVQPFCRNIICKSIQDVHVYANKYRIRNICNLDVQHILDCLHAAKGTSLIYGSPHHHNTNSKVECINGVIADVLPSFRVSRRQACRRLAGPRAAGRVRDQRFRVAPREWLHALLRRPRPAPPPPACLRRRGP